jgi:hypothetical protein
MFMKLMNLNSLWHFISSVVNSNKPYGLLNAPIRTDQLTVSPEQA